MSVKSANISPEITLMLVRIIHTPVSPGEAEEKQAGRESDKTSRPVFQLFVA